MSRWWKFFRINYFPMKRVKHNRKSKPNVCIEAFDLVFSYCKYLTTYFTIFLFNFLIPFLYFEKSIHVTSLSFKFSRNKKNLRGIYLVVTCFSLEKKKDECLGKPPGTSQNDSFFFLPLLQVSTNFYISRRSSFPSSYSSQGYVQRMCKQHS